MTCADCGGPADTWALRPKESAQDLRALKKAGIPVRVINGVPMRMMRILVCTDCMRKHIAALGMRVVE